MQGAIEFDQVQLVSAPELDRGQAKRQTLLRGDQAGVHQNAATGVEPRASRPAVPGRYLLQNADRLGVFMPIGELGRVVKNQDLAAPAVHEPFAGRSEVTGQNIRLADLAIAKEPVCRFRIGPALASPLRRCACSGRQLLQ